MPPDGLPPLRLLEDPAHPGAFVVKRFGTLSVLLIVGLGVGLSLVGTLVRLQVPVPGAEPPRRESVSLARYVARELGLPWP